MSLIRAENVTFRYGDREVLSDVSFEAGKGSLVMILGDNGSGKSTLLSLLDALLVPTYGKLYINDLDTSMEKNHRAIRRMTGFVFQDPSSSFVSDILEKDTSFSPRCWLRDRRETVLRTGKALKEAGLYDKRKQDVKTLSGGERQKAAVAGVRTMEPEIYLFDEALSFLDGNEKRELLSVMRGLAEEGRCVIGVSHYAEDAIRADRVLLLADGKVIRDGSPREVLYDADAMEYAGIVPPPAVRLMRAAYKHIPDSRPLTEEETAEEVKRCMHRR